MENLEHLLQQIIERQNLQGTQLQNILVKLTHNELTAKQTEGKFEACAKGFYQVKEACEVLLERLDSACGTITEQSWN
jgi:predicted transcriptional regulator